MESGTGADSPDPPGVLSREGDLGPGLSELELDDLDGLRIGLDTGSRSWSQSGDDPI